MEQNHKSYGKDKLDAWLIFVSIIVNHLTPYCGIALMISSHPINHA
jgi:hypothetical protein